MLKRHPTYRLNKIFPPNVWLGILVQINALIFFWPLAKRLAASEHHVWLLNENWQDLINTIGLIELPRFAVGLGLFVMSFGLFWRARIAWIMSLLLIPAAVLIDAYTPEIRHLVGLYSLIMVTLLIRHWQTFGRSSFAASTMYVIVSFSWLMLYAVIGTLYFGNQFKPPVLDLMSSLYFSIVTMTTVGYGDILPQTPEARLFVLSIIIFGVSVFATTISALAGPVIGGNLKKFVKKRALKSMRTNHVIVCGATPLAMHVVEGLLSRGHHVTAIVLASVPHLYPEHTDVLVGDATTLDVLTQAGLPQAQYLLALREDDSENAFIILAAKELIGSSSVKTVAVVNEAVHLSKIQRVQPDIIFSPQLLGGEILTRTLTGEKIDESLISKLFFNENTNMPTATKKSS